MNMMADQLKGLKATMEKPKKTMTFIYTGEFPNVQKLIDIYGATEASSMLGLSDIGKAVNDGKVRPAYEMAAAHLLGKKQVETKKSSSLVLKMTDKQAPAVIAFLDALGIAYMDLDL